MRPTEFKLSNYFLSQIYLNQAYPSVGDVLEGSQTVWLRAAGIKYSIQKQQNISPGVDGEWKVNGTTDNAMEWKVQSNEYNLQFNSISFF